MTKEYIERPSLIGKLTSSETQSAMREMDGSQAYGFFLSMVNSETAADVVEVKHGEWDDTGRYKFPGGSVAVRCSECGCCLTAGEYRMNVWNYCPVCGARMDGGADNG